MGRYQYRPLSADHREIRLVRLQPGSASDAISVEIFHTSVSSKPKYEALSYAWGCPDRTRFIRVRRLVKDIRFGKRTSTLGIAENLHFPLQNLRYLSEPRILWIDAICINQDNTAERSKEVMEMDAIYNNALQVVIWLGPSSHNSALALQTLERIGNSVTHMPAEGFTISIPGSWPANLESDKSTWSLHADSWFAIKELLSRKWFSRLWVFQEISLAQRACLVAGEAFLDWRICALGLWWVWMMSKQLDRAIPSLEMDTIFSSSIWSFLTRACQRTFLHLTQLLDLTKSLLCTDPRDRLYAIRSLLLPPYSKIIIPDYSLNVNDVYLNFTKEWLLNLRTTNLLSFCDLRHDPGDHIIIRPSWVPDFNNISNKKRVDIWSRCSGNSSAFVTPNNHDRHITVHGVLMGTLTFVTEPTTLTLSSTEREVHELCLLWKRMVLMDGFILSKEISSFDDSFGETIINGLLSEKLPSVAAESWMKLESVKSFLVDVNNVDNQFTLDLLRGYILEAICDRLLFKTADKSFGIGPLNALPGDHVAIVLGCDELLILRPDETDGNNHFQVIGPCYISGLADGEGLLGPVPFGWSVRWEIIRDEKRVRIFTNGNIQTQQDPRISLPPAWKYRYGDWETPQEVEAESLEDMKLQWFENIETGEKSWFDPSLTPELLRERGVAVEELTLI